MKQPEILCNKIDNIASEFNDLFNWAEKMQSEMSQRFKQLEFFLSDIRPKITLNEIYPAARVRYMAECAGKYIAHGYTRPDAIALTAKKFKCGTDIVSYFYASHNREKKDRDLYAQRKTAKTLKAYGMSNKEIGAVLKVHENHVLRLIKEVMDGYEFEEELKNADKVILMA